MAKIKTKRERVKFASDNVAGACPEVLDAVLNANDGDSTPYGNDEISTELQDKFSEIFEKEVIVFPTASGTASNALALSTMTPSFAFKIASNTSGQAPATLSEANLTRSLFVLILAILLFWKIIF